MNLNIERILNKDNISRTIELYNSSIKEMDSYISANNSFELLRKIKKQPVTKGPYSGIPLLDAASRIINDLVLLYGIRDLLYGKNKYIDFPEYHVYFEDEGPENRYDFEANHNGKKLVGVAFSSLQSMHKYKRRKAKKRLTNEFGNDVIKVIMYDEYGIKQSSALENIDNTYYINVKLDY